MEHLSWYPLSKVERVRVPFICGNDPICNGDNFHDYAQQLGWESDKLDSFDQIARRAQAWLFFGLLGIVGITPDQCIRTRETQTSPRGVKVEVLAGTETGAGEGALRGAGKASTLRTTAGPLSRLGKQDLIDTSDLPTLLNHLHNRNNDELLALICRLTEAMAKADHILTREWIPFVQHLVEGQDTPAVTLWNSEPYAVLFSIDVLLDTLQDTVSDISHHLDPEQGVTRKSLFPKLTSGVDHSLLYVGKCGSLVHRLDLTSSEFYHLLSLPNGLDRDHSGCAAHCGCFNVNKETYRTNHVEDCVMCEHSGVLEEDLLHIIRQDEVPVIRSIRDRDGNVKISIVKMTIDTNYIAISHVWACGLGNFHNNSLPQCQLDWFFGLMDPDNHANSRRYRTKTCYYWLDTLCIPVNYPDEKKRAINSMGRIYAGATKVLVLDPTLSKISLSDLQKTEGEMDDGQYTQLGVTRANMLIDASPWMARSWPLQEAGLARRIYVQFADGTFQYHHERLGIAVNLASIPNKESNERRLTWSFEGAFDRSLSSEFNTGEALSYSPNTEFIKVWNQLAKRTTSFSDDIPAIFAALLYKSAGELLDVAPCNRTQAILRSLDSLPLDILTSKCDGCRESANGHTGWVPKLPGSQIQVPTLEPEHGILQRVANGFLLQRQKKGNHSTRALICPSLPSGRFLLADPNFKETFHVQINAPTSSKGKRGETLDGPHLLLLLSKSSIEDSLWNSGVLCTICEHTEDIIRVQLVENSVTWRLHYNEHDSEYKVSDRIEVGNSCEIVIKMGMSLQALRSKLTHCRYLSLANSLLLAICSVSL